MKKQINFSALQRLDLVDANDLQELLYNIIDELTSKTFKSGQYSVANATQQDLNIRRTAAHGPLSPIVTLGIDQAEARLNILDEFSVIERNTGELITFTQEEIDLGYGVIDLASLQSEVDDDPNALRQNDLTATYSGVGIFAYLLDDTERESRQFYDIATSSTVSNVTTVRNTNRLRLFAGLYEKHINTTNDSGQYPTLLGKYEFGRIEDNVRTDAGGGNFVLNPVEQWFTLASFVSNLVWGQMISGMDYFDGASLVGDNATPNALRLPNAITSPETLRHTNSGANTLHDMRLAFKYIQRLINRIQCNGTEDPTTTDLGDLNENVSIIDNFGVATGLTKAVNNSLVNEHPPYSLRGLKRFIDVHEHNTSITASVDVLFERYTTDTDAFPDGITRTVVKAVQAGPNGSIPITFEFDFYDTFTSYLGVSAPGSEDVQMTLGDASASSITGALVNTSGTAITSAQAQTSWMRNLIVKIPSEYANWHIVDLNLMPITSFHPNSGPILDNVGGVQNTISGFMMLDGDNLLEGNEGSWQTAPGSEGLIQVKSINWTNSTGGKTAGYGMRFVLGPNTVLNSIATSINSVPTGFKISLTLRNNNVIN